jgi:trans-aconitate 2-methyltransferase
MNWSAQQYAAFEQERTRPVRDLVAALPARKVRRVVDLGCGPGNSTEILAQRFPQAAIFGTDASQDMLATAQQRLPQVQFEEIDIASWNPPERFDLILANASLQWLPEHAMLYPRLLDRLTKDGLLAVQTPDNLDEPTHRLAREIAATGPWARALAGVEHPPRHDAPWYYTLLCTRCAVVDVWRTTYYHPLAGGAAAIVDWVRSAALTPYLDRLEEADKAAFLTRYHAAIQEAYQPMPDGSVLLRIPRLFLIATR